MDLICLQTAIQHIPTCYNIEVKSVNQRLHFISELLSRGGMAYTPVKIKHFVDYLTLYCPSFVTKPKPETKCATKMFNLHETNFNRFLAPPISSCLKCGTCLKVHNAPTKAMVFSVSGPLPSTKVTLECRECGIQYGISKYSDAEGQHYYPKEITNQEVIEVSNVTYVEANLYNWIPSLG